MSYLYLSRSHHSAKHIFLNYNTRACGCLCYSEIIWQRYQHIGVLISRESIRCIDIYSESTVCSGFDAVRADCVIPYYSRDHSRPQLRQSVINSNYSNFISITSKCQLEHALAEIRWRKDERAWVGYLEFKSILLIWEAWRVFRAEVWHNDTK